MNRVLLSLVFCVIFLMLPKFSYSQEHVSDPYIICIVPDSLMTNYEFSQTIFITVSIESTFASDPTEKALQKLQKKIIEACKLNKMEAFILKEVVFAKPYDEGKLICYGTMIRRRIKNY